MLVTMWKIDDMTHVTRSELGYTLLWAGVETGYAQSLSELASGALLDQCREAVASSPGRTFDDAEDDARMFAW